MKLPFDASPELKRAQQNMQEAIEEVLHVTAKLNGIKAKTGPVTAAGTRMASMLVKAIRDGKIRNNKFSKQTLIYLAYATIDTLMREDIEGGIMDKSSKSEVNSIILYIDNKKEVPREALEVLQKRFSQQSATLLFKLLTNMIHHLAMKTKGQRTITSAFRKNGFADPMDQILGKMWKADWSFMAEQLLRSITPTEGADQLIAEMLTDVPKDKADTRLLNAITAGDFKDRKKVLQGAYEAAKTEEDDDEEDEINTAKVEKELAKQEADAKAETKTVRVVDINEKQQAIIDHIRPLINALKKTVSQSNRILKHVSAVPTTSGVLIKYSMKVPTKWDAANEIHSGIEHAILIPTSGLIADAIYLSGNGTYKVVDGIFDVLSHALAEGKSASNILALARQRMAAIYKPNASNFVHHAAVVITEDKRMQALEEELDTTFKQAIEDGWDIISLSSPNKPASIWAPRVGFKHTISANGDVVLKKVGATSRVTEYELRSNPLARFTDPKRCTTSLWAASPDVTDDREKIRFDVRMADGKLLVGIEDGIQPLIMFASSETVKEFYPLLKSNNPYAGVHEDAYMINQQYFNTLKRGNGSQVKGVVKISIARNKGLTISAFKTPIRINGIGSKIELIARNDNSRENKLATQMLSAARLAAELLGFKRITLREGFEMQVLEALVRECRTRFGFNPLDATVTFKGVDGQIHKVEHVVVGRYQALVDVSQRYTAHVSKYGATFKYFSAKNVAVPTMPEFVKLAKTADKETSTRARLIRALKNMQKKEFITADGIRYVSLGKVDELVSSKQVVATRLYNTFTRDKIFNGFVFVQSNGNYTKNLNAPQKILKDINDIAKIVGFDNLQLSELDEQTAYKLTIRFGDSVLIPIGQDRNGRWVVIKIQLVAPAPVSAYTDADNTKHFVLTKEMKTIFGIVAYLRTKDDNKRMSMLQTNLQKLISTMKGAAYYYAKHPAKIPAVKGRAAAKVNGHEDGFTVGKRAFIKLIDNKVVLQTLGLNAAQIDTIFSIVGELTVDHAPTLQETRELKATIEQMRSANGLDAHIPIIAQRSPTLNYLGFGFLEDVTGAEVIGIPHKHGLRMAADDDGDPVTLMFADKVYKSFFDVLGVGTSTSRR